MKKGFTLAEVLIALAIIGIIAVLTIPPLFRQYELIKTEAQVRKFYSTMQQVLQRTQAENGDWKTWAWVNAKTVYDNYFKDYLSVLETRYQDDDYVWLKLKDGTCAVFHTNLAETYGTDINNYFWKFSTDCSYNGPGRKTFEFGLYNFKDPWAFCAANPHSCGWEGVKNYAGPDFGGKRKRDCPVGGGAWSTYKCTLKFLQDGLKFKEDYNFFKLNKDWST